MQISAATIEPCCGCGVAVPCGVAYCDDCMEGFGDEMAEALVADYGPRGRVELTQETTL